MSFKEFFSGPARDDRTLFYRAIFQGSSLLLNQTNPAWRCLTFSVILHGIQSVNFYLSLTLEFHRMDIDS
jgi:hypothetical protein